MVDDLHDLRLLDAVYGLGFLIVVYQDVPFLTYIQESPPGNKAAETVRAGPGSGNHGTSFSS